MNGSIPEYSVPQFNAPSLDGVKAQNLSASQAIILGEAVAVARNKDIFSGLSILGGAIQKNFSLLHGIESDDLDFSHDAASGKTSITISKGYTESVKKSGAADIGEAEQPFMVYQLKDDGTYGFDFIRLVPEDTQ